MSNNPSSEGNCRFQNNVDCNSMKCMRCGWNPKIAHARIVAWQANRSSKKQSESIS